MHFNIFQSHSGERGKRFQCPFLAAVGNINVHFQATSGILLSGLSTGHNTEELHLKI